MEVKRISKAERLLIKIQERLNNPSTFYISKSGVPYLVTEKNGENYSICYFGRYKSFRIFVPYRSDNQRKFNLKLYTDVIEYFNKGQL